MRAKADVLFVSQAKPTARLTTNGSTMRTLAIDLGTRRVGLALSDAGGRLATPLTILQITAPDQAIEQILPLIVKEGIERLVVGLPLNMDDTIGPAARTALAWGRQLELRAGKNVLFVDERLSSFMADDLLSRRKQAGEKLTHGRKKQQRDALAAAAFLQQFLDGQIRALQID